MDDDDLTSATIFGNEMHATLKYIALVCDSPLPADRKLAEIGVALLGADIQPDRGGERHPLAQAGIVVGEDGAAWAGGAAEGHLPEQPAAIARSRLVTFTIPCDLYTRLLSRAKHDGVSASETLQSSVVFYCDTWDVNDAWDEEWEE